MNTDIRIAVGFFDHHKTRRLIRFGGNLGHEIAFCMLRLWAYAAQYKPSGQLGGMDVNEIADAAGFRHEASAFVSILKQCGFLDKCGKFYAIHDWAQHQPYVIKSPIRSDAARKAAESRWNQKRIGYADRINAQCDPYADRNAPSPSPSPSPSPNPKEEFCAELPEDGPSTPSQPVIFKFLCARKGETFDVTQADIDRWKETFPHVEVLSELKKARLWCEDNPGRRKTAKGMRRFLSAWIERSVDRPGRPFVEPEPKSTRREPFVNRPLTPEEKAELLEENRRRGLCD